MHQLMQVNTNKVLLTQCTREGHMKCEVVLFGMEVAHLTQWLNLPRSHLEGLHDAIRTYTRTILPCCLVSFRMAWYREKNIKNAGTSDLFRRTI